MSLAFADLGEFRERSLALTGMMGSGKSTVAARLGQLLSRRVVSTDVLVVHGARKPIERIFAEDGEPTFRVLERQAVASLRGPLVIDLGGGAFCDAASAQRLLAVACVVFLDVSPGEAARRIGCSRGREERPLSARWEWLNRRRRPLYLRAHHRLEVDGLSAEATARRIHDLVVHGVPARSVTEEGAWLPW
ncbi:MAG TPA: shikimate kinase [Anaeromyxobacteraceae bacterium]|nr:shikimate kinase [Anaeromyxobacteraceae bacterium]